MSETFQASNGKYVARNGGYLGFGDTAQEAERRANDGQPLGHFLFGDEWAALTEFTRASD
jgi:hypothetical protein